MSDSESVDYLQPEFDQWSLTVPRLRSILVTHNIQYPATAKKPQLIELFNDHVVPQSKKYLAARARVKRMSKGIVDANSQSTASTDFNEQELMPPPPSSTRARSPRKSTRVKRESEDPEHLTPAPPVATRASPRKRQSRSVSTQPPAASDTETGGDIEASKSATRRRVTPSTPALVKKEAPEETNFFKRTPETETVFSSDNPFQSGSSPPPTVTKTPSNRRKTTGMDSVKVKNTPSSRRRTDGLAFDDADETSAISRSFEMPLSKVISHRTPEPPSSDSEPGEEFTPEEQLALFQEEQANPALAAARRKHNRPRRQTNIATPIWVLLTTLLCAYAAWYRQEKIAVGYCDLGREPRRLLPSNVELPDWATELTSKVGLQDAQLPELPDWAVPFVEPQCEPCPLHAYCYEDFTTRCEQDFILKPHPLSFGGLVPLPPTCEPDGEKVRRVRAIADKGVEELRDRRAKYECGESLEPEGPPLETPVVEEQELKETLSQKRNKRMAAEEFDDLWVAAIGEIKARDEVQVQVEESPAKETGGALTFPTACLSSTSLARLSHTCAIRRSVKLGLARHRLSIGGVILSLLSLVYGRNRLRSNRALSAQIPGLVDEVLERLANQKEVAFEGDDDDAFLFLPNLRDDVLRSMHSLAQRDRLWQRVRAVVEQNSNVRTGQREGRNGEVGRAWEWIGPSRPGITEGSGPRRRKSTRVSWGPDVTGEENESTEDLNRLTGAANEMVENKAGIHRRWKESRPIY
ncbi:Man1-Src1p-C-terminal domain-containing protein [Apodospora peruviana]|uniref:Man1-Src1p-C-terminal domain-containing protein n=1 Tax=Apodospora peruviana TaxID=516989 RepID=A0AAE0MF35_9PEZI|nr:Man1-Src1p-C-terminal domain-containing protein [Apodospora peruviana]